MSLPQYSHYLTNDLGPKNSHSTPHARQLGFNFTAHNSQSRSLNAAIIDLESCATIAASYVILSRIKCGEDDLRGLAILRNINEKNIRSHAPQEVRNEESRLKDLAAATLERAKNNLKWYLDLTRDSFD
ncbi:hypothetical protein B0H11DRAFT_1111837 [Mycena galericulata]|nr:hypothetical protein B0H11DRAFT_1111837 [Mycena galericulata]